MLHVWNITYISPKCTVKMVGKYTIYTHGASIWVPKSHKIHRPFRVEIARLVSAPLMGQSHFGDGFFKGFHEQPGGRWDPKKLPEILGVEESFKIRRSVSEIQREKLWVLIKSWPGDVWFNKNNLKTHTHTDWLSLHILHQVFSAEFSSTVSLSPRKTKRIAAKKSRTFRWSFASSQVLQHQPQLNQPLKSCRSVSIGLGVKQYPAFGAIWGGFKTIYGCYMLLQVLIHHVI